MEVDSQSDAECMARIARGDTQAFALLFDRHHPRVLRFNYRFSNNWALAEEWTQDTFLKLYRSADAYVPTASFLTYLFRIAKNHCLNELRRSQSRREGTSLDEVPEALHRFPAQASTDERLHLQRFSTQLQQALGQLPDRERLAFGLCRIEGLSTQEVADVLEMSLPAAKSLIHRTTLKVAQGLQQYSPSLSHPQEVAP